MFPFGELLFPSQHNEFLTSCTNNTFYIQLILLVIVAIQILFETNCTSGTMYYGLQDMYLKSIDIQGNEHILENEIADGRKRFRTPFVKGVVKVSHGGPVVRGDF